MLRAGIPMREADQTDLARYLRVLAYVAEHKPAADKTDAPASSGKPGKREIILRRGTIEDIW